MHEKKTAVGIIGCGNISGVYFTNLDLFENVRVAACADLNMDAARAKAKEHKCRAMSVEDLLDDKEISIVLNLTVPKAHFSVAMSALKAGKHIYGEKPLTLTRDESKTLLQTAAGKGLRAGNAPDTFLGGSHQTCRKILDDGWIGGPVAADAFMLCHGHESWHPSPEFYYEQGGGPMFDMGPYYLTALVNLMGPVKRVCGSARKTFPERRITSAPKYGKIARVETPTHIAGIMDFTNGAIGTIITSFDTWDSQLPRIEIHGTRGSMIVPDPNGFGGPILISVPGRTKGWQEIPPAYGFLENKRGVGVADMAAAIHDERPHRATGELAAHVLDVMQSFIDSSEQNKHICPQTACERPAPLPLGLPENAVCVSV
ncbi:MAG: Gfo/Idh/MocA family oxidoreductase [bacterium]